MSVAAGETKSVTVALTPRSVALEGVVVTSKKRVQQLQNVPVAITAYDGTFPDDLGIGLCARAGGAAPGGFVE